MNTLHDQENLATNYKLVPGLRDVQVNGDGTSVLMDGKELHLTTMGKIKYLQATVRGKSYYVHRLVAMAFVSNISPVSKKLVVHKDGDLSNNSYTNLQWCSAKELVEIQKKNGVFVGTSEERKTSKISKDEAMKIAQRLDSGEVAKDIAKEYGVSDMSITRIRQRYCKKKVSSRKYGYEIKHMVADLFKANKYTKKQIAQMTGITYETIYRWYNKFEDGKFPIDGTKGLNGQPIKHGKRKSQINYNV